MTSGDVRRARGEAPTRALRGAPLWGACGAALFALVALVALVAGCSSGGSGSGVLVSDASVQASSDRAPVEFSWESSGPQATDGTMEATVPGRGTFIGTYLQVVGTSLDYPVGYQQSYGDEPFWYGRDSTWDTGWDSAGFSTAYSDKVLAVLENRATGERMSCEFHLLQPPQGPAGGGQGTCKLGEESIENVVLQSD